MTQSSFRKPIIDQLFEMSPVFCGTEVSVSFTIEAAIEHSSDPEECGSSPYIPLL
jgi:hypothetical protein